MLVSLPLSFPGLQSLVDCVVQQCFEDLPLSPSRVEVLSLYLQVTLQVLQLSKHRGINHHRMQ